MRHPVTTSKGLTLMELLVTVSIVGILTSLAVPSFTSFIQDRKHDSVLNNFNSSLAYTRSEAVKRGIRTVICASTNGSSCSGASWTVGWLVFVDDDSDGTKDSSEEVLQVGEGLDSGFTLLGSSSVTDKINYEPDGDTIETGAITLCDPRGASEAEALIITPSGRAKVSDAGLGGAALTCS